MDCTNCAAPLPAKTTRCPYCGTMNDVDLRGHSTVRRGSTERNCPRCRESLEAVLVQRSGGTVEIDQCPKCRGLFFDPGEIESVLDDASARAYTIDHQQLRLLVEEETPTHDFEQVAYVPCPDCEKLMNRQSFGQRSGVVVDRCREHGVWLDGGELRRLVRWAQAGGQQHAQNQAAERRANEEKLRATKPTIDTSALPSYDPSARTLLDDRERSSGYGDWILVEILGWVLRAVVRR